MEYNIFNNLVKEGINDALNIIEEIIHRNINFKSSSICILNSNNGMDIKKFLPTNPRNSLLVAFMNFTGEIQGRAYLVFHKNKIREFMRLYLNSGEDHLCFATELSDIDLDILKETGNIILTYIIGKITNSISENLEYTLTETQVFIEEKLNEKLKRFKDTNVFIFPLTINVESMDIQGCIILNLNLDSLDKII